MNDFKSKLDDLLDELERCCASQHFEVANDIRAKIHKLIKNNIPQWHKLIFIPLTEDEKESYDYEGRSDFIEGLPEYGEEVLVTDGKAVWVDRFDDIDECVYLSGTDDEIDGVIAWMEMPSYKEEQ
jgi:hypothetical protein